MTAATRYLDQPADKQTTVDDSGGMFVSAEALARFGGGDAHVGRKELRAMLAPERNPIITIAKKPDSVRLANQSEEEEVLALLMMDLADNGAHIAVPDPAKIMLAIQAGTRNRGGFVGVIGKPIAAVIVIHPYQWWWSNGWFLQEIVHFVHPDHRKSHHADDLLEFAKWLSDNMTAGMGYPMWLLCGVLGAWRVHAKVAFYRRKFRQAGAAFVYPAPPFKRG